MVDKIKTMMLEAEPFTVAQDPMALSILAALGLVDEKKRLRDKAAADESALQSLLAIYGFKKDKEESVEPTVSDPLAQSILTAALGYRP